MEQLFTVNNKPLLKQVIEKLLEIKAGTETELDFNMSRWYVKYGEKCGTVACIAGITCLLANRLPRFGGFTYALFANKFLDIQGNFLDGSDTYGMVKFDEFDNHLLFVVQNWPIHYKMIRRDSGTLTAAISYLQDLYNDAAHFDSE